MIAQDKLFKEQQQIVDKYEKKYLAKYNALKTKLDEKINISCESFSKCHSKIELDIYKHSLELGRDNKLKKLKNKLSHKLAKKTIRFQAVGLESLLAEERRERLELKKLKYELKVSELEYDKKETKNAVRKYDKKLVKNKKHLEKGSKYFSTSSKRIWEVDFLRGIAIWGMMIDHYIYDFYELFPTIFKIGSNGFLYEMNRFASHYWVNDFRVFVRLFGVFLFVFLCGISCKFAKSNWKRGILIVGLGLVVTGALCIVSAVLNDPSLQILLSTLTTIGLCIIIYWAISTLFKKISGKQNWKWWCLGFTIIFFVFWGFMSSYSYLKTHTVDQLIGRFFYVFNNNGSDIGWTHSGFANLTGDDVWKIILGLKGFGADWLGLFPYVGYIFLGGFVGETLYADRKSIIKYFYHKEDRKLEGAEYLASPQGQLNAKLNMYLSGVSYPGKHTLFVYIFHQPVFLVIMVPILLLMGYAIRIQF